MKIPASFPVRPLRAGHTCATAATCGACGQSWDDGIATSYTPAPSGRCPFESFHRKTRDEFQVWGNYGYGWDEECSEPTRREGLARLREYRENGCGQYQLRHKRIRVTA